ncbi:hypothetical protein NQZ68_004368 [Dissostichus eleginoides]|nr:hypothetical protein NQZ68_004368 [Dissostichus eleginoides]
MKHFWRRHCPHLRRFPATSPSHQGSMERRKENNGIVIQGMVTLGTISSSVTAGEVKLSDAVSKVLCKHYKQRQMVVSVVTPIDLLNHITTHKMLDLSSSECSLSDTSSLALDGCPGCQNQNRERDQAKVKQKRVQQPLRKSE